MPLDLQYDIVDDTPAAAGPVQANFNRVEQYINQELIARDGHVAMTGQLRLSGPPVADLDAAPKNYVDAVLPVGIVMSYGGGATPPGGKWLICDGKSYSTADYPELFAVIAYVFGGAGGSFNVPDLGGKMTLGTDASHIVGSTGGSADSVGVGPHTHAIDHTHAVATSSNVSADHVHTAPLHTHKFPHTHPTGEHIHYAAGVGGTTNFLNMTNIGNNLIDVLGPGSGPQKIDYFTTTGGLSGASSSGGASPQDTEAAGSASTGGISANHTHTVQVPGLVAATGPASASAVNGNLPPYIGLMQIIRAR
jgi:microcystin-dependent protein